MKRSSSSDPLDIGPAHVRHVRSVWSEYEDLGRIGVGGFSEVFRVRRTQPKQDWISGAIRKVRTSFSSTRSSFMGSRSPSPATSPVAQKQRRLRAATSADTTDAHLAVPLTSQRTRSLTPTAMRYVQTAAAAHSNHVEAHVGEEYALKMIAEEHYDVFANEVALLQQIPSNPYIVRIVDAVVDKKGCYVVTEFCNGKELFDRILDSECNEQLVANYMRQILSAVQHLHQHQIVHLDLKPENFVFDETDGEERIKLIDFGSSIQTKAGVHYEYFLGSLQYASPEILPQYASADHIVLSCADMWTLGVIAYTMLVGKNPFQAAHETQTKEAIFKCVYTFPPSSPVSPDAQDFIVRLLRKDPLERMTATEALQHEWIKERHRLSTAMMPMSVIQGLDDLRRNVRLKRAVAAFVCDHLPEDDRRRMESLFHEFDADNSGLLEASEIATILELYTNVSASTARSTAAAIVSAMDAGNTGGLSKEQFMEVHAMGRLGTDRQVAQEAFDLMDSGKKGVLSHADIESVLERIRRSSEPMAVQARQLMTASGDSEPQPITLDSFFSTMGIIDDPVLPDALAPQSRRHSIDTLHTDSTHILSDDSDASHDSGGWNGP